MFRFLTKKVSAIILCVTMLLSACSLFACGGGITWYEGTDTASVKSANEGDYFIDLDDNVLYKFEGGSWKILINNYGGVGPEGPQGADGATGAPGATGADGATWLTGTSAPTPSYGKEGDFYLNSTTGEVYTKSASGWGTPIMTIKGQDSTENPIVSAEVNSKGEIVLTYKDETEINLGATLAMKDVVSGNTFPIELEQNGENVDIVFNVVHESIDDVVFGNKTYREIFLTSNNILPGNMIDTFNVTKGGGNANWGGGAGSVALNNDVYNTAPSSLYCAGSSSQQLYKIFDKDAEDRIYMACKVKVTRYVKGKAGMVEDEAERRLTNYGNHAVMFQGVTNGFETMSWLTQNMATTQYVYLGTISSADCDAYVDDIVLINLDQIFGDEKQPTKEQLDVMYENFLSLYNGADFINVERRISLKEEAVDDDITKRISDDQAKNAFYAKMAEKATRLGMTMFAKGNGTSITTASGLQALYTTTNELVALGAHASGYDELMKVWNVPEYQLNTKGVITKNKITSTVVAGEYSHCLTDYYFMMGGKTGSGSRTPQNGDPGYANLLCLIAGPDGETFVGAVSMPKEETAECNRFSKMKIAFDIAMIRYSDPNADVTDLEAQLAEFNPTTPLEKDKVMATVIRLPKTGNIFSYDGYDWCGENSEYYVYDYNGNERFMAMSVTKVMTATIMLDYVGDLGEEFTLKSTDIESGSGPKYTGGEIMTYRQALYNLMLPSSNTTAKALSRVIGYEMFLEVM